MNKFLQISLGVSAMLLSSAFLIKSIQPAHAEVAPMKQLANNTMASGKYMMNQTCVYNAEGTTVYHYVLYQVDLFFSPICSFFFTNTFSKKCSVAIAMQHFFSSSC